MGPGLIHRWIQLPNISAVCQWHNILCKQKKIAEYLYSKILFNICVYFRNCVQVLCHVFWCMVVKNTTIYEIYHRWGNTYFTWNPGPVCDNSWPFNLMYYILPITADFLQVSQLVNFMSCGKIFIFSSLLLCLLWVVGTIYYWSSNDRNHLVCMFSEVVFQISA